MDKTKKVIKEVAEELDVDPRIVELVGRYQSKFVRDVMSSGDDDRAVRLPYFGVYAMKANKEKGASVIHKEDIEELGFRMTNDYEDSQLYKSWEKQIDEASYSWYELEIDKESKEVSLMKWIATEDDEAEIEIKGESLWRGAVRDMGDLRNVIKHSI